MNQSKKSRKTTGKFETRLELEQAVWYLKRTTQLNKTEIAANTGVSRTTVDNILNNE